MKRKEFREIFKELRIIVAAKLGKKKATTKDVADQLGVTVKSVNLWVYRNSDISLVHLLDYCYKNKLDIFDLVYEK